MVDFDHYADKTPRQTGSLQIATPTVAALKTALFAADATAFSQANMRAMTKRDLIWAARQRSVTVPGLI